MIYRGVYDVKEACTMLKRRLQCYMFNGVEASLVSSVFHGVEACEMVQRTAARS